MIWMSFQSSGKFSGCFVLSSYVTSKIGYYLSRGQCWYITSLASRARLGFLLGLMWVWKNEHLVSLWPWLVIPCCLYSAFLALPLLILSACVCQTEVPVVPAWHLLCCNKVPRWCEFSREVSPLHLCRQNVQLTVTSSCA